MNRSLTTSLKRREFLKSTGLIAGAALTGLDFPQMVPAQSGFAPTRFTQQINEVRLYMTYYAFSRSRMMTFRQPSISTR